MADILSQEEIDDLLGKVDGDNIIISDNEYESDGRVLQDVRHIYYMVILKSIK